MIKVPAPLAAILDAHPSRDVSEPAITMRAEDEPAWAAAMRRARHGEPVPGIAHGDHVAGVVPPGELDRLRETIEVLSGTERVRDLREGPRRCACWARVLR